MFLLVFLENWRENADFATVGMPIAPPLEAALRHGAQAGAAG